MFAEAAFGEIGCGKPLKVLAAVNSHVIIFDTECRHHMAGLFAALCAVAGDYITIVLFDIKTDLAAEARA